MWLAKYGYDCFDFCDFRRNSYLGTQDLLQCFGPSIKVIAEAKYDIFPFVFMDL